MAFGRERARTSHAFKTRAFLTMAALFATVIAGPARAQDTAEPNVVGLEGADFRDRTIFGTTAPLETTFRETPRLNFLGSTPRVEAENGETETDEIIVTANREEEFTVTPHPDFVIDPFARAGITTNLNPENDGLELFPIRRDDIEGWRGVDVDLFNTGRFSIEAQVKRGPGLEFTYHFGRD